MKPLSPTQISTYRLCKRKWAFASIEGIRFPPNASAEFGTQVHDALEHWLRDGKPLDLATRVGKVAAAGLQYLPKPGVAEVEQWFNFETDITPYHGKIDAQWFDDESGMPVVHDHKTTSDFKWAKNEEDLKKDEQTNIYATAAMVEHNADKVRLQWTYHLTSGVDENGKGNAKAKRVHLVVDRAHVEEQMELIEATAQEMVQVRESGLKALDLEPEPTACKAYGGCPYISHCNLTSQERMKSVMAQQSLAEKMRMKKLAEQAAGGAAPAAAVAAPAVAEEEEEAAPAPPPAPKVNKLRAVPSAPAAAAAKAVEPPAINPPEAPTNGKSERHVDLVNRDLIAANLMGASIARGESFDDELARAKTAYVRADALIKAR